MLALLQSYRFRGTRRRVVIARNAPRDRWGFLKNAIPSDVVTTGPLFEFCQELFAYLGPPRLQVSKSIAATKHKDRNDGGSFVLILGWFSGGALCLADGTRCWKRGVLHRIPLGMEHWVEDILPDAKGRRERYSIVFYALPAARPSASPALPQAPLGPPALAHPPGLTIIFRRVGPALPSLGSAWPRPYGYPGLAFDSRDIPWNALDDACEVNALLGEIASSASTQYFAFSFTTACLESPKQLKAAIRIARFMHMSNHLWSFDLPGLSAPQADHLFSRLLRGPNIHYLEYDTCMYHHRLPGAPQGTHHRCRRRVFTNIERLQAFMKM